ncbi:MAG: sorbosone dehydrogenase family protein [Bacteroidota bacterium]
MSRLLLLLCLLSLSCINFNSATIEVDKPLLDKIQLPDGFQIELYAEGVKNARSMALGEKGTIFVGTRSQGKVYALVDKNGDYKVDKQYEIAKGLKLPNGVAFRNGSLYVAEVNKIWRYDKIEEKLSSPPEPVVIRDDLPTDRWHGWKYIAFGPDDKLYVPVGAPCNICEREDERYASILHMNPDGSDLKVYAHGVRNTVGFDWHPETNELWFTDNGRDMMGNDLPPDELNHAPQAGMHFGFPYCHAGEIADPKFGEIKDCSQFTPPAQQLNPHGAALGVNFYEGDMFPEAYKHQVFIAEHGSWNRDELIGYRLSLVRLEGNKAVSFEAFAEGWLQDGKAWGRPVALLQLPDGSLLVSDDMANVIYRITYTG